jgi:hypothetical protein
MTMPRLSHLVPLAALAAGCGGGGDSTPDAPQVLIDAQPPDAMPRETVMEGVLLAPNEPAEGIMTGGAGDVAVIHVTVPGGELDWNIHGHANGGTQIVLEKFDQPGGAEYTFAPTARADWYLLIRNSGPTSTTFQVKVELYGNMQWRWE